MKDYLLKDLLLELIADSKSMIDAIFSNPDYIGLQDVSSQKVYCQKCIIEHRSNRGKIKSLTSVVNPIICTICKKQLRYWLTKEGIQLELRVLESGRGIPERQFRLYCLIKSTIYNITLYTTPNGVALAKRLLRLYYPDFPIDLLC